MRVHVSARCASHPRGGDKVGNAMRVTVSGVAGVWWNGQNGVGGVRVYVCLEVEDAHTSTQYTSHTFHTSSYSFAKAHTRGVRRGRRMEKDKSDRSV